MTFMHTTIEEDSTLSNLRDYTTLAEDIEGMVHRMDKRIDELVGKLLDANQRLLDAGLDPIELNDI